MSDSYPTIQDYLSDTQKEFMGCVEMHLDPPEDDIDVYEVDALFRHDDSEAELPGNAIRFVLANDESDSDINERWHMVEFLSMGDGGGEVETVGHIRHTLKRVEAQLGRYYWTECRFEVDAPDMPRQQARYDEVEDEVKVMLARLKALDRGRRLVPA